MTSRAKRKRESRRVDQGSQPISTAQILAIGLMQNFKPLAWVVATFIVVFGGFPYLRDIAVAWSGKDTTVQLGITVSWVWGGLSTVAAILLAVKYHSVKKVHVAADGVTTKRSRALGVSVRGEE